MLIYSQMNSPEKLHSQAAQVETQVAAYLLSECVPEHFSTARLGKFTTDLLTKSPYELRNDPQFRQEHRFASDDHISEIHETYLGFLSDTLQDSSDVMRKKAEYVARYDEFADAVDGLRGLHPIGRGGFSQVYKMDQSGEAYAVRKPRRTVAVQEVDKHLEAAARVSDLSHLEHIAAASYQSGVTIADFVPGRPSGFFEATQQQLDEAYVNLIEAEEREVGFDPVGENLLYDSEKGFCALDIGLLDGLVHVDVDEFFFANFTTRVKDTKEKDLILTKFANTLERYNPDSYILDDIKNLKAVASV